MLTGRGIQARALGSALALAVFVVLAAGCASPAEQLSPTVELTAQPFEEPAREPEPNVRAAPSPSPSPSPSASPSPSPSPAPAGPSASDQARFVAAYAPPGASGVEHVAVDLDGDETSELLFTFVRDRHSQVEIAAWTRSRGYAVVAKATGGPAQRIDRVRVGDVNADGTTEIVTMQAHEKGASLTAFAVVAVDRIVGLRAVGGCFAGSATYGVVGADLTDVDGDGVPEIVARCPESPLPVSAWSEQTYRWSDGAYRVVEKVPPGQDDGNRDGDGDSGDGGRDDGGGGDEDDDRPGGGPPDDRGGGRGNGRGDG